MRTSGWVGWLVLTLAAPTEILACPLCEGKDGVNEVRRTIFASDFWTNLLWMAVPFGVCAVILQCLYYGPTLGRELGWSSDRPSLPITKREDA